MRCEPNGAPIADHSGKLSMISERARRAGGRAPASRYGARRFASLAEPRSRSRYPSERARANPNEPGRAPNGTEPNRRMPQTMAIRTNQTCRACRRTRLRARPNEPTRWMLSDRGDPNEPALARVQTNRAACRIQTNPAVGCPRIAAIRTNPRTSERTWPRTRPNEPGRTAGP